MEGWLKVEKEACEKSKTAITSDRRFAFYDMFLVLYDRSLFNEDDII